MRKQKKTENHFITQQNKRMCWGFGRISQKFVSNYADFEKYRQNLRKYYVEFTHITHTVPHTAQKFCIHAKQKQKLLKTTHNFGKNGKLRQITETKLRDSPSQRWDSPSQRCNH